MKKMTILFTLFLLSRLAFSPELEGKYIANTSYYIFFDKGRAEFNIGSNGGLEFPLKGIGEYYISSNYLFIRTSKFKDYPKKYYSKDNIEEIIENQMVIFKIVQREKEKLSLTLLTIDSIQKFYTPDVIKEIENQNKDNITRDFKK